MPLKDQRIVAYFIGGCVLVFFNLVKSISYFPHISLGISHELPGQNSIEITTNRNTQQAKNLPM